MRKKNIKINKKIVEIKIVNYYLDIETFVINNNLLNLNE